MRSTLYLLVEGNAINLNNDLIIDNTGRRTVCSDYHHTIKLTFLLFNQGRWAGEGHGKVIKDVNWSRNYTKQGHPEDSAVDQFIALSLLLSEFDTKNNYKVGVCFYDSLNLKPGVTNLMGK